MQCKRCVMDDSDVNIRFDENGFCNHCNHFFQHISNRINNNKKPSDDFYYYIKKIKKSGRNKLYDCIIGVSGGMDSSYLALLAKQSNLRALLVHVDNGWNTEILKNNIQLLSKKLEFDLEIYTLIRLC